MRYVSPAPPPSASSPAVAAAPITPAVRRTVGELHAEAGGRAWAGRVGRGAEARLAAGPATLDVRSPAGGATADDGAASDRLAGLLAQLRAETTRYVCALRADGVRPEQMLVRVKAFVREAMAADGWHDPEAMQALTARVVAWSVTAYYDR